MLNSPTPNYESAATGTRHSSVITTDDNQLNDPATSYIRSEQAGGPPQNNPVLLHPNMMMNQRQATENGLSPGLFFFLFAKN